MKKIFLAPLLLAIMQSCLAEDTFSNSGKHYIFGVNFGVGEINTDLPSEEDNSEFTGGIFYGYQYNSKWTINAGFAAGSSIDCIIACLDDLSLYRSAEYNSYILNIKRSLPLSRRWSVFGKLGANYYNSKFYGAHIDKITDRGVGALLATGFDFRAFNGFGVGFEAKWLDMGDINATNYTVNFSHMF